MNANPPARVIVKCACGKETEKPYGDPPKCFQCWRREMGGKVGVE